MELFNETKNNYYLKLTRLINEIMQSGFYFYDDDGMRHTASSKNVVNDIFKRELEKDLYVYDKLDKFINEDKNNSSDTIIQAVSGDKIQTDNPGEKMKNITHLYPVINKSISVLPCRAELTWLKTALNEESAKLFFTKEELEKLKEIVSVLNTDETFDKYITVRHENVFGEKTDGCISSGNNAEGEEAGTYAAKLQTMLKCLHENRSLKYSYNGKDGKKSRRENDITVPYKIEYSITDDKLKLSSKPDTESRPVKGNVADYYDLEPLQVNSEKPKLKDLVEERKSKEPLVLTVHESTDSDLLKRILVMFAKYNREVSRTGNNSYTITINSYSFLRDDLINEIISLGPQVTLESPHYLRNKLTEKISAPFNW